MTVAVALFTRDLRVHDNPVLHAAARSADQVVPLFVLDERILTSRYNRPNRARFLADSLADLHTALRELGAALVLRRGDVASEVACLAQEVDAAEVHIAADVSGYAQMRHRRLDQVLGRRKLVGHDSVTVVAPGSITPNGKDHFAVFTPYLRHWERQPRRAPLPPPTTLTLPSRVRRGKVPCQAEICRPTCISAASPPPNWPAARPNAVVPARPRSSASWPGGTSITRSWSRVHAPPTRTTAPARTTG
ncbi:MAG: deoxyribodipyrimidine photo-lyase [Pseudonocardiaceae bacterium]